jgi:hypothetical protein
MLSLLLYFFLFFLLLKSFSEVDEKITQTKEEDTLKRLENDRMILFR